MIPSFLAKPNDPDNLFTYNDAISGSNSKERVTVMVTEMEALNRLKTWSLVPRPLDRRIYFNLMFHLLFSMVNSTKKFILPEGFCVSSRKGDVYRLHKSLYSLKQAGRVWNANFDGLVTNFGLIPSAAFPCRICVGSIA